MMAATKSLQLVCLFVCYLAIIKTGCARNWVSPKQEIVYEVDKTIVHSAVSKGAVCLDGSPPAYHFAAGFGEGEGNWFVQLSGGGWCSTIEECLDRSRSDFGSSKLMKPWKFEGIYSTNQSENPDFYNWNKVFIRYCDGGSFTGDVESVDPATNLHFRGARIFEAVMEDLLAKGLKHAKNAFLSGGSAGGYPAMLYCDRFHDLLPNTPRVKCLVDSGYFIHVKSPLLQKNLDSTYSGVFHLHGSIKALPKSCMSKMKPELCFFGQYIQQDIKTPLFIVMSAFDNYQTEQTIRVDIKKIIQNHTCTSSDDMALRELKKDFLSALPKGDNPKQRGAFIDTFNHHTELFNMWNSTSIRIINNLSASQAFADWYFDRSYSYVIDTPELPQPLLFDKDKKVIR